MRDYLEKLCHHLGDALRGTLPIAVHVNADRVWVLTRKAVPIGLIVNELVTNAFKYAFSSQGNGTITVSFSETADQVLRLIVEDDGAGCPEDAVDNLGSKIMRLLVQQLAGRMTRENAKPGCRVTVEVPRNPKSTD
jgi:two-component sensor histidine kinase